VVGVCVGGVTVIGDGGVVLSTVRVARVTRVAVMVDVVVLATICMGVCQISVEAIQIDVINVGVVRVAFGMTVFKVVVAIGF
jgi:hypothetical protein